MDELELEELELELLELPVVLEPPELEPELPPFEPDADVVAASFVVEPDVEPSPLLLPSEEEDEALESLLFSLARLSVR